MAPVQAHHRRPVLALSGGTGGSKLAVGLARVLDPGALMVVANTGDDFEHLGLHISPDIDTLTYALAGVQNHQTGWGRCDETWSFMATLGELGGETWFKLGDRDLALHVERTRRLRAGAKLSTITSDISRSFGISSRIVPMTDDRVRTRVVTADGMLDFQRYFVEAQCLPKVTGFVFDGAARAQAHSEIIAMLQNPDLRAVIICPSNPYVSIDPMLALTDLRAALACCAAPVIVVSPIIGGRSIKGPTAKIMNELGHPVDVLTIAAHYHAVMDGFMIDTADAHMAAKLELPVVVRPILMRNISDREELANATLEFADHLAATQTLRRLQV